jgi:hypothetical protein
MSFVAAKFALPTVSKPDGTLSSWAADMFYGPLGGYVQYPANPRGQQFIWPAQRIAILLAKQKAEKAKKKSGTLGLVHSNSQIATDVYNAGPDGTNKTLKPDGSAQQQTQPNQGMSYALALAGILAGGGVIIALTKALSGGTRTGRPIPGAHVYEGL